MKKEFGLAQLNEVARWIIQHAQENKVLCFYGSMGAGKTTLIKALIKNLGAVDAGNSPTFGLVNEYADAEGNTLAYHFDFYRIDDETEALDLGIEDYFYSNAWVFIEWPERIPNLIPEESVSVHLSLIDEKTRQVEINAAQI